MAVFDYQGDLYIFQDTNGSASFNDGDGAIKVTGVSTADLDDSVNFFV